MTVNQSAAARATATAPTTGATSAPAATSAGWSEDERAIRAVIDRLYDAFVNYDADAFVADYTEDATSTLPGTYRSGRTAVRDRMAQAFTGPLKGARPTDEVQSVRFLGSEGAVVTSRGTFVFPGETESPADRWFRATWTLAKQDSRWLVAAYHSCAA